MGVTVTEWIGSRSFSSTVPRFIPMAAGTRDHNITESAVSAVFWPCFGGFLGVFLLPSPDETVKGII